jgi:acyl-CoA thioester hydrolase
MLTDAAGAGPVPSAVSTAGYDELTMAIEGEIRLRVRYAETDQMGVVYHANYLVWMELGRTELCRRMGVRYRDMEELDGVLLTVAEVSCRYMYPARYDEDVLVQTTLTQASPRLVRFGYEMKSFESERTLATGATTHVFCGRDMRPCKLPVKYRHVFGLS